MPTIANAELRAFAERALMEADVAAAQLGQRVVFAETLGQGLAALEGPRSAAHAEVLALAAEIAARFQR